MSMWGTSLCLYIGLPSKSTKYQSLLGVYNSQGDLAGIVRSGTGGTRKSIYSGDAKAIKPVLQSDPPFPTLRKHYGKPSLDSRKIARMAVNYTLADIRRVQGLV
jgi:hypothetical protein